MPRFPRLAHRATLIMLTWLVLYPPTRELGAQTGSATRPPQLYAIVVGIEAYSAGSDIAAVPGAQQDALDFQKYVGNQHEIELAPENLVMLQGPHATQPFIRAAIERVLARARTEDRVYLFFSARGITERFTHRGFLLVHDTTAGNNTGTALPVEWLQTAFKGSYRVRQLYLFADLCREPSNSNDINERLAELANSSSVKGVLASQPNRPSVVIRVGDTSSGLFSSVLVDVLQSHAGLAADYGTIVDSIRNTVQKRSSGKQIPLKIADAGGSRGAAPVKPIFARLAVELAALGIPNLSFLFQQRNAGPVEILQLRQSFRQAIADGRLIDAGGAYDILQQYRPFQLTQGEQAREAAEDDTRELSAALEDAAEKAVSAYGRGEEFPNDPLRLSEADYRKAADLFDRVVSLDRGRRDAEARAWFCRGRANLLAQNWAEAERDFNQAISLNNDYPEPFNGLGVSHLEQSVDQNRHSQAMMRFREAISRAPEWAYPRHNLALTLIESGEYRTAETEYREAIRLSPYHPYLSYNLGLLLQKQNHLKAAEDAYRAALQQLQKNISEQAAAVTTYSRFLSQSITDGELRRLYQRELDTAGKLASALTQNEAEAYNALGTVREQRKDPGGAAQQYRQAFALNPDLLAARHNLALLDLEIYRKSGGQQLRTQALEEAFQLWSANLSRAPDDRASLLGIAGVYRQQNNLTEATAVYRRILAGNPNDATARGQLALTLAAAGDLTVAEPQLLEAILLQTSAQNIAYAAAELHEELGKIYARDRRAAACAQFKLARQALTATGGKPPDWLKRELRSCKNLPQQSKADAN